jgi:serine/threonine protein phosphatase 1
MPRLLAIGDIHGHSEAFKHLLNVIKPAGEDVLVLLGDYINRGPDSKGVIEIILGLRQKTQLICLRGNHEQMLLNALESKESFDFWCECGGDQTLRSYGCAEVKAIPDSVIDFMGGTLLYHETEKCIFAHANVDFEVPMESQSAETLLWRHIEHPPAHQSGKVIICGHTPQTAGLPVHFGSAVCIDTDVCRSGWLTCYEPLKSRYWQCHASGKRRADILLPDHC